MKGVLPHLKLENDILSYAKAYNRAWREGYKGPERWISYVDSNQYLWFEEYPMPNGQPNLVLNGHIFAVLALHEAHEIWPTYGFDRLVCGGLTAVKGNFAKFSRRGKPNLYSLRGPVKSDYLPVRTVRQQFQLFLMAGDMAFLANAMCSTLDSVDKVERLIMYKTVNDGIRWIGHRRAFDAHIARLEGYGSFRRILAKLARRMGFVRKL